MNEVPLSARLMSDRPASKKADCPPLQECIFDKIEEYRGTCTSLLRNHTPPGPCSVGRSGREKESGQSRRDSLAQEIMKGVC